MTWLVTGGAGYIGSHIVKDLRESGSEVVVLDDLSTGVAARLPDDVPLLVADIRDTDSLIGFMKDKGVQGVVHLAAKKAVGESMSQPLHYYDQNLGGLISLLAAMQDTGVDSLVYSSSAAVYGSPDSAKVEELSPTTPESPYGETKLIGEWLIRDQVAASDLKAVSLRYFNVVGAANATLGDTSVNNLVPLIFSALTSGKAPQVFGDDYPTLDGSCVRDYIDVRDLARAHVKAIRWLTDNSGFNIFNIGRGEGVSVKAMMQVARQVTEIPFEYQVVERRAGDPAHLVGDVARAEKELGWQAQYGVNDMVLASWQAFKR